jgi:EpsD family peptidyl-prolyl cis-trans isomerase
MIVKNLSGRVALIASLISSVLVLSSCEKDNTQASAPKGQVIAHIGKDDVTAQELENEFRWLQIPADKRTDAITKRVLGDLVQRKYLVQKAIEAKLDRQPTVLLDMLRSREQTLASALLRRDIAGKSTAIGKGDVEKYILNHPLMFEKRTILTVDRITMPLSANSKAIVESTKNLKSLEEIEQKLKEQGVLFNRSMGVINSGDIPEQFFNTLTKQKPDDVFFVPTGNIGVFFKVKGQEIKPLPEEDASRLARQMILRDLMRDETSKQAVSAEASATYEGDYKKIMSEGASAKPDSSKTKQ